MDNHNDRKTTYHELVNTRKVCLNEIMILEANDELFEQNEMLHDYQKLLKKLVMICERISQMVLQKEDKQMDAKFIFMIQNELKTKGISYENRLMTQIKKRKAGKKYHLKEHIQAMIYAMLSNQSKWKHIEQHLPEIDVIFYGYDPEILKSVNDEELIHKIYECKCGNISTAKQMEALPYNIQIMEKIEQEYGSMDAFLNTYPANELVEKLSSNTSKYKLKMMGKALIWEYLRNVGIDGAKPDVHIKRFLSNERMGYGNHSPATEKEVYDTIKQLAYETGLTMIEIDAILWSYCADGYGAICTANPHCHNCCIKEMCHYDTMHVI